MVGTHTQHIVYTTYYDYRTHASVDHPLFRSSPMTQRGDGRGGNQGTGCKWILLNKESQYKKGDLEVIAEYSHVIYFIITSHCLYTLSSSPSSKTI